MPAVMKAMRVPDVLQALLGSSLSLLGTVAGSQSLAAQLELDGHGGVVECLVVGVADDEGHVVDAFLVHVVDSIASSATYSDDLDDAVPLFGYPEIY